MADTEKPTEVETVQRFLGLGTAGVDTESVEMAVDAANAFVARYKDRPADGWTHDTKLGATMLAAQLYRRRNTPGGVEQFGETGMYVRAVDADVERLLRVGRYAPPRVG